MEPEVSVPVQAEPEIIRSERRKLLARNLESFNKIKTPGELHQFLCDENVEEQYKQLAVKRFFAPMTKGELARGFFTTQIGDRSLPLPENVSTVHEKKQYRDIACYNGLQYARRFMDYQAIESFSKEYYSQTLPPVPGQHYVTDNVEVEEFYNTIKNDLWEFYRENPKFQEIVSAIQRNIQKEQEETRQLSPNCIYYGMIAWTQKHKTHPRLLIEPALGSDANLKTIQDWTLLIIQQESYENFFRMATHYPEVEQLFNDVFQRLQERDPTRNREQLRLDVAIGIAFWVMEAPISSHTHLYDAIKFPQIFERIIELALENQDGGFPKEWGEDGPEWKSQGEESE